MSTWPSGGNVPTSNVDESTDDPSLARPNIKTSFDSINAIIASYGANDGIPTLGSTGGIPRSQLGLVLSTTGGAVSGAITLPSDPTQSLHAATKAYVDAVGVNDDSIATSHIKALAITSATLAAAAVTSGKIAVGAILSADIGASQVVVGKLGSEAVQNSNIGFKAVTTYNVASDAVGQSEIKANSVGVGEMKKGNVTFGLISADTHFGYQQYVIDWAIEKIVATGTATSITYQNAAIVTGVQRLMRTAGFGPGDERGYVHYVYITASENPHIWACVDTATGEIVTVYDSEDPLDREFPDISPIFPQPGQVVVRLDHFLDDPQFLQTVFRFISEMSVMPSWVNGSIYKEAANPQALLENLIERQFTEKGKWHLEDLADIRGIKDIPKITDQQRRWRYQIWLREMVRVLENSLRQSLPLFFQRRFKYLNGKLQVK